MQSERDAADGTPFDPIEQLLGSSGVAMIIGDMQGIVVACNELALQLLRAAPTDVIGQSVSQFDEGRSAARVAEMHAILLGGGAARTTTTYRRIDGSLVRIEAHVSPCVYAGATHMLGVVVPLSEVDSDEQKRDATAVDAFSALGGVVVRCAWCGRVRHHPLGWRETPAVEWTTLPVSHGICESCATKVASDAVGRPSVGQ